MALITCKECSNQISDTVKQCPQCGAKVKKSTLLGNLGVGFIAITIFGMVLSALVGGTRSTGTNDTPSAKPAPSSKANKPKEPNLVEMAIDCEVEWEQIYKSKMNDPGSLDWDDRQAQLGKYQQKPVVMVPYRAKNGFGATSLQEAICQIDASTGKVKAVLK